jgi:hypothetical protein
MNGGRVMNIHTIAATRARLSSERGVSLIHAGIVLFGLILISALVADNGLMFMVRAQAQNAADAGALSGAISRAFDDPQDDPPQDGIVADAARGAALAHAAFDGSWGTPVIDFDCPAFVLPNVGCVTVNMHRDGTGGSDGIPTVFAHLFGSDTVNVQATATAQAAAANATDCLRPFGVPDLWEEGNVPPTLDQFKRYLTTGGNRGDLRPDPDVYRDPWDGSPTGYNLDDHFGTELHLVYGPGGGATPHPGWYMPLDVPQAGGGSPGAAGVNENIAACNGVPVPLQSTLPIEPGAQVGPIRMGIEDLIAQDPDAFWDGDSIEGSCVPECGSFSPRTITLAVFDPDIYQYSDTHNSWPQCSGGGQCVTVVGFLGFFVDRMDGNDVIGYLVRVPGVLVNGGPPAPVAGAFTTSIRLVR